MADLDCSQTDGIQITFGCKGELNNPVLLRYIQNQEPLAPAHLLKLARFFNNTLLNAALGEALQLFALATIVGAPELQKPIQQLFGVDGNESNDQTEDQFPSDWPPIYYDEGNEDTTKAVTRQSTPREFDGLSFIFVPLFDNGSAGLLVKPQDTDTGEILYFAVGVCPNPQNLDFSSANRA